MVAGISGTFYDQVHTALLVPADALYKAHISSSVHHCEVVQSHRDIPFVQIPNQRHSGPVLSTSNFLMDFLVCVEEHQVIVVLIPVPANFKRFGIQRWRQSAGEDSWGTQPGWDRSIGDDQGELW